MISIWCHYHSILLLLDFSGCAKCVWKPISWDWVLVLQCIVLYSPVKKDIHIYLFSHKYGNISVRVIVWTCSLPTSYKSRNCLKHNQTAFQRNVSVNERLSGQCGMDSAQGPIRAAPCALSAGCTLSTSCAAPCSHMETAGSLVIVVSSAKASSLIDSVRSESGESGMRL